MGYEIKHPPITALREPYSNLVQLQKSFVLAWVTSRVGIQENQTVDTLTKETFQMDSHISVCLAQITAIRSTAL